MTETTTIEISAAQAALLMRLLRAEALAAPSEAMDYQWEYQREREFRALAELLSEARRELEADDETYLAGGDGASWRVRRSTSMEGYWDVCREGVFMAHYADREAALNRVRGAEAAPERPLLRRPRIALPVTPAAPWITLYRDEE